MCGTQYKYYLFKYNNYLLFIIYALCGGVLNVYMSS
jgi:hypothetical protein